jgi:hypothetical protein
MSAQSAMTLVQGCDEYKRLVAAPFGGPADGVRLVITRSSAGDAISIPMATDVSSSSSEAE